MKSSSSYFLAIRIALVGSIVCFALDNSAAEELRYASAESAGVSNDALAGLKALLEETNTRAAVVLHKGRVVAEWYWKGEGPFSVFECWSTSKSVASTCIGLLVDEGKIASIDDPVSKYIPSWSDGEKAKVTIAHLLDQTSGLEEQRGFVAAENQLQMALDAKILTPPGEQGRYNNAACNVLSAIITAAAGKDPEAYMREKIWQHIGMDLTWWRRDRAGNVITYAGLQTTARELARFGQLLLNGGQWEGKQLISKAWIDMATTERTRLAIQGMSSMGGAPYGLLWWLDFGAADGVPHSYSSLGLFGNNMTIIPELELVGVRLVGNDREGGALMARSADWVKALAAVAQPAEKAPEAVSATR
jgi:CubicO group peptidase (beta-lactamase class C family)